MIFRRVIIVCIFIFYFSLIKAYPQIPGKSFILNGSTDYIEVPNNSTLGIPSNLTIEAWIFACDVTGLHAIVDKLDCSGDQNQFHLSIIDGFLEFVWDIDGNCSSVNTYKSLAPVINVNHWYHVAVVHTNSSVVLYVNGSPIAGSLNGSYSAINLGNSPCRIGVYKSISGIYVGYFKGRIDEVRVWNLALSSSDISNRYNSSLNGNEAGLVLYDNMDVNGVGANIVVPNIASSGSVNDGLTIGSAQSPFFLDNSIPLNCSNIICLPPQVNLGNDTTLCYGATLSLNVGSGYSSYVWQDASNLQTFNVTSPGKYWVTVSNECGTSSDSISIDYDNAPKVNLGNDTILCSNGNVILKAPAGYVSYNWQDNSDLSTFNVTSAGKYWVAVYSNCGSASDSININYETTPQVNLGNDTTLCPEDKILIKVPDGYSSYQWQDNSSLSTFYIDAAGTYYVTVHNYCGTASDTINIDYHKGLFIPNLITPNNDGHNDNFEINPLNNFVYDMEVFNRWGASLYKNENYKNEWTGNALTSGIYYYIIRNSSCKKVYKGWVQLIK